MSHGRVHVLRRVCTSGRLLAVAGLLCSAAFMLTVINRPWVLGGWAAGALLATVFAAFLCDRLLGSVMDRVDRFERTRDAGPSAADRPMRDAA